MVLTATDVQGTRALATVGIVSDLAPRVTVEPAGRIVTLSGTRTFHLKVTCEDESSEGCAQVYAYFCGGCGTYDVLVAPTDHIDQDVTLPGDGRFDVIVTGEDRLHQTTAVPFTVYVETNPHLEEVARAPDETVDATEDRLLTVSRVDTFLLLKVRDRASGQERPVGQVSYWGGVPQAELVPGGVFFLSRSGFTEWRDGTESALGSNFLPSLSLNRRHAVWPDADRVVRRDLTTRTDITVSEDARDPDVADNGDVVFTRYHTPGVIYRWRDGTVTAIAEVPEGRFPQTDGGNVVFALRLPLSAGSEEFMGYAVVTAQGVDTLAPIVRFPWGSGMDFGIGGSWIYYPKPVPTGQFQVFARTPQGEERQVSFFGQSSAINLVGPNGGVFFTSAQHLYFAPPGGAPVDLGGTFAKPLFVGDEPHVIVGGALYPVQ